MKRTILTAAPEPQQCTNNLPVQLPNNRTKLSKGREHLRTYSDSTAGQEVSARRPREGNLRSLST